MTTILKVNSHIVVEDKEYVVTELYIGKSAVTIVACSIEQIKKEYKLALERLSGHDNEETEQE